MQYTYQITIGIPITAHKTRTFTQLLANIISLIVRAQRIDATLSKVDFVGGAGTHMARVLAEALLRASITHGRLVLGLVAGSARTAPEL